MNGEAPAGRGVLHRAWALLLRPRLGALAWAVALMTVESGLGIASSLLSQPLFDRGLLRGDYAAVAWIASLQTALFIAGGLAGAAGGWRCLKLGWDMSHELARRAYDNVQRQSLRFFVDRGVMDLTQRLRSDVDGIQVSVSNLAGSALAAGKLVCAGTAMLIWDWRLAAAAFATLPASLWISRLSCRSTKACTDDQMSASQALGDQMYQTLSVGGYLLTATCGAEKRERARFARLREEFWRATRAAHLQKTAISQGSLIVNQAGNLALYLVGAALLSSGGLSIGKLTAYCILVAYLRAPVAQLTGYAPHWGAIYRHLSRVFELLDAIPQVQDPTPGLSASAAKGRLSFRGVRFGYDKARPVLDGLDFEVRPGEITAIVGPTGAGKTTTAYLMMRFLDPDAGDILLDGRSLKEYRLAGLREKFSFMTQDSVFFNVTVRENLLISDKGADDHLLERACREALIWDRVKALSLGLDTQVGEAGYRFSGGERQRLALARVFLKDAPLYLLDEPTASLDDATERRLLDSFRERAERGRAVVIITHKTAVMEEADSVISIPARGLVPAGSPG